MRRAIVLLWVALLSQGIAWLLIPLLVLDLSGPALAGLSWVAMIFPYVLFGLKAGQIGDSGSRRYLLIFAMGLMCLGAALIVGSIFLGSPEGLVVVLFGALLIGTARPFLDSALLGLITDQSGPNAAGNLSLAVAGELAGRGLGAGLLALVFLFTGKVSAALMLLVVSAIALGMVFSVDTGSAGKAKQTSSLGQSLRVLFAGRELRLVVLFGVFWNFLLSAVIGGLTAVVLKELLVLSDAETAVLIGLATAVSFLASLVSPWFRNRFGGLGSMKLATIAAVLSLASFAGLGLTGQGGLLAVVALFLAFYFFHQVFATNLLVERQLLAPSTQTSLIATTSRLVTWLGLSLGSLTYAPVLEAFGPGVVLIVSIVGGIVLCFSLLTLSRSLRSS
jgi:hypothetical protein